MILYLSRHEIDSKLPSIPQRTTESSREALEFIYNCPVALRYATERGKAYRILDLTSLTEEEFAVIVTPFDQAFLAYMQDWTL
ncbi:MAG: hypothetical protein WA635_08115, partial [Gallionella sp.]